MSPHATFGQMPTTGVSDPNTISTTKIFPVDNSLDSYWLSGFNSEMRDHRTTPELPEKTDIVIIGAGYAGAATAYHLLKEGTKASSITILEARGACSGATGRNGGHLRPDLYGHILKYCDRGGASAGKSIAEFEIANMWAIKKVIEEEGIDCDFALSRAVDAWCNEQSAQRAKETYDKLVSLGFEYLKDVFFTTDPKQAEGYSGVKGAKAAASFTAGSMYPYKFITQLLKILVSTGKVNLQTYTPVRSVQTNSNGQLLVKTDRGSIAARKVVHASNGYVSGILPEYQHNIIPCKGICCHIKVPDDKPAPYLGQSYILWSEENVGSYLIPRTDGSIIVGGASSRFKPYRAQWYRNVDDGKLIDAAKDYYDGFMQRTFRGWEDSDAGVDRVWTGVMGYSFDSNPHIGPVPSKPGQYIAAGFNGHGMPVIWLSTKALAQMIVGDEKGEAVNFSDTGCPLLFETSQERIDRATQHKEEQGDILGGDGSIFLPSKSG